MTRLVVVSNRVPSAADLAPAQEGAAVVGGLVSAVKTLMLRQQGLWMGWSGSATSRRRSEPPTIQLSGGPVELATIDLTADESNLYYLGFSNRTLWPLFHTFPERTDIRHDTYRAYQRVNERFAQALHPLLTDDDLVWVHDYQLILVGSYLRRLGWNGNIGFFLHIPFPAPDVFEILPWARELLDGMLEYDLVGFHTQRYRQNFVDVMDREVAGQWNDPNYTAGSRSVKVRSFPIGIEPDIFHDAAIASTVGVAEELSLPRGADHKIVVGVDRLDYTKGIPERLRAFERMLDRHANMRGRVTLVQITQPSRSRVREYREERETVERLVGQINGRFSDAGWVPVRYLYRFFSQTQLARFYHDSHVGMVTPLRDGMNLIAKEYIAAQGDDPGALVLSKFSGAAVELTDAVQVNPYDTDGTAEQLYQALRMPHSERVRRWRSQMDAVTTNTARSWGDDFFHDLQST
ncbi:MAG: trehalose-6-phosphate synthase [SAR202 cluster bacterium]|nr:trehalose-6-phosphate synthase [SAR202 cluster bacterium]